MMLCVMPCHAMLVTMWTSLLIGTVSKSAETHLKHAAVGHHAGAAADSSLLAELLGLYRVLNCCQHSLCNPHASNHAKSGHGHNNSSAVLQLSVLLLISYCSNQHMN